jgi:hypothetical protein
MQPAREAVLFDNEGVVEKQLRFSADFARRFRRRSGSQRGEENSAANGGR